MIKMIIKGRSPTMRHASRTHRVALDCLLDRINLDPKIVRYTSLTTTISHDNNNHRTSKHASTRVGALMAHHPAWVRITRVGPGQNPQYTRAHFGGQAVGCSPTPQHTTMSPRKRNTITTKIQNKYVDTKNQFADMLTKGSFTRDEWNHLLRLLNIMSFSMFSCSHHPSESRTPCRRELRKGGPKKNLLCQNRDRHVWCQET